MGYDIRLKRIHDAVEPGDGFRILVDRVWPRGVRKADANLHRWMRDVAPSSELRRWFGHDPQRWQRFRERYLEELANSPESVAELVDLCRQGTVTLLFAARDRTHNQAAVLQEVLLRELTARDDACEPASPVCWMDDFPDYNDPPSGR